MVAWSYDYLTSMTFKQLTRANLQKLEEKLKETKQSYSHVDKKIGRDLWVEDLVELSKII